MSKPPNVLILSDLHLSRGYYEPRGDDERGGHFSQLEDFFGDDAFFNFVAYHVAQGGRWQLVFNGDLVDFLQVVDFPTDEDTLASLRQVLHEDEEWESWQARKREYGLGTTYIETCWKLEQIAAGHPTFFQALAYMLATGNEVIVIKGNHDVEWHWPQVQERMRELIRRAYDPAKIGERLIARNRRWQRHEANPLRNVPTLDDKALARLKFCPRFYYIRDLLYVEHGCQYEVANSFPDFFDPVLPSDFHLKLEKRRIELPFGSFFVRYFFNRIEQATPFADNIKPISRYLKWVLVHHPLWAIKTLLTRHDVVREIWHRLHAIHADRTHAQGPLRVKTASSHPAPKDDYWHGPTPLPNPSAFLADLAEMEEAMGSRPPLLYLKPGQWFSAVRKHHSDYLYAAAAGVRQLLRKHGVDARYFVLGHDHNAAVRPLGDGAWYYNCGTWTMIEGEEERFFREAREFTYVKITPGGEPEAQLLRWNDGARRGERVVLMADKDAPRSDTRRLWGAVMLIGGLALLALAIRRRNNR